MSDPSTSRVVSRLERLRLVIPSIAKSGSWKKCQSLLKQQKQLQNITPQQYSLLKLGCVNCIGNVEKFPRTIVLQSFVESITDSRAYCFLCALIKFCFSKFEVHTSTSAKAFVWISENGFLDLCLQSGWEGTYVQTTIQIQNYPLGGLRQLGFNPKSIDTDRIKLLLRWIKQCDSDHPRCATTHPREQNDRRFLPTRLIELQQGSTSNMRLIAPTEHVQYIALSYCWGRSTQASTLKHNVSYRRKCMLLSELSRTLQDAILVTRALGCRFIWIDALCIVQDDENDWATEASRMSDIYAKAWLVLAASTASDCREGFLRPGQVPVVIKAKRLPDQPVAVSVRRTTSHKYDMDYNLAAQPLLRRAWAMQERELACRVIHFLPDEILRHCQSATFCECSMTPLRKTNISPFSALSNLVLGKAGVTHTNSFGVAWVTVIESYHKLDITNWTDMLPALSGIAQYVEPLHPGKYIAGLWEKDIVYQLAWWQDSIATKRPHLPGPSFSWVAAKTHVRWPITSLPSSYKARCKFVAATSSLATINPYGHIFYCSITLEGRVLPGAKLRQRVQHIKRAKQGNPDREDYQGPTAVMDDPELDFIHIDIKPRVPTFRGDYVPPRRRNFISRLGRIICLELYEYGSWTDALLLQRIDHGTNYVRIGLARWVPRVWFDKDGEKETITIT